MGQILAVILSPIGRVALTALAFFVWLGFHDAKIANRARGECQSAQLQKTIDEISRQREAAKTALSQAETQAAKTESELLVLEKERDQAVADLQKAKAGKSKCPVPSNSTKRLRDIR